jgi:hypothetical protein
MKKIIVSILLIISLLIISSCGKSDNNGISEDWNFESLRLGEVEADEMFSLDGENVRWFTLSDNGDVIAVTENHSLARFNRNGDLIEKYDNAGVLSNLYYSNNKIYAYDVLLENLIAYDLETKTQISISEKFDFNIIEIKDLIALDDMVLVLLVPVHSCDDCENHFDWGRVDENGYTDFGELLYKIDLSTGKVSNLEIHNIISIYRNTMGNIFYYAYKDNNFNLYHYDITTGQNRIVSNMNDVGYLFAFIYEGNNFTYINSELSLLNKNISEQTIDLLESNVFTASGSNVWFYAGHMVYLQLSIFVNGSNSNDVTSIYIGYLYQTEDSIVNDGGISSKTERLTISAWQHYPVINTSFLRSITGISGIIQNPPLDSMVFLTEIMAGNENVDIYIINSGGYVTNKLIEMGFYVPLNESEIIYNYVNNSFDYILDYSKNTGEIWGIPLSSDASAIIYVPENFNKFELTYDNVKLWEDYIITLENLKITGEVLHAFGNSAEILFFDLYFQYGFTYNDFQNKYVNFRTDIFRNLFSLLDGYRLFEGENHPLFKQNFDFRFMRENGIDGFYSNYPEHVIFKSDRISNFLNPYEPNIEGYSLSDWRVFPSPRISENVEKNDVLVYYVVINPNSRNIDAAKTYLEAIAENPHNAIQSEVQNFTQRDISFYEGTYDISLSVFQDIFNLFKNGIIVFNPNHNLSNQFVDDYQRGRRTLEETIDMLQREYEMALNE